MTSEKIRKFGKRDVVTGKFTAIIFHKRSIAFKFGLLGGKESNLNSTGFKVLEDIISIMISTLRPNQVPGFLCWDPFRGRPPPIFEEIRAAFSLFMGASNSHGFKIHRF